MSGVDIPYPVEARNFLGEELIFGRCNSSDGTPTLDDDGGDGPTSPASMDDVLHYFTVRLNATYVPNLPTHLLLYIDTMDCDYIEMG